MDFYPIEKGIPIPERCYQERRDRASLPRFEFDRMRKGDSFAVPPGAEVGRLRSAAVKHTIANPRIEYTTRKTAIGGLRIWRIR